MSWTTVFPVLTDEMLEQYEADSTAVEKAELAAWFSVREVINAQPKTRHVVSTSLFWKHPRQDDPDLPKLDRKTLKQAKQRGLVLRFDPWSHYVQPLLDGARQVLKDRSDLVVRVYLAGDLDFLVKDLVKAGCEVRLMHSSSVRHNPGAMWRFLAFEEKNSLVTMADSDRLPLAGPDILRTEEMAKAGLGLWRVPVWGDLASDGTVPYRPMFGGQFGGRLGLPMRRLMKAFVWHSRRGTISAKCQIPACGERPINGGAWPDYGFDEYFLIAAVYPRAARKGVLSFVPSNARSQLLPLDIEYVTWSNPRSEVVYFGAGSCCGPALNVGAPTAERPRGLKRLADFALLEMAGLTQRHPLPEWAPRSNLGRRDINGEVWAWFNPASIVWQGQRWLAYRTECSPLWHWSRVSLARLDESYRVIPGTNRLLELPTNYGVWGAEDPRLLLSDDRLLLSYSDGLRTGLCELKPDGTLARSTMIAVNPFAASLTLTKDTREKNWGFFSHGGKIFVSYWVAPQIVFAYDERRGKLGRRWVTPWTPPIPMDKLHGSSPPVWHDGLFWRVVHSSPLENGGRRTYRLWLMAFAETPPFEPRWFCQEPLVIAEAERAPIPEQVQHDVVFCGSIERTAVGWHLFFGENDRRMRHGFVEDALIAPHLVRVKPGAKSNGFRPAVFKTAKNATSLPANIGPCDIVVISLPERKDRQRRVRNFFAKERLPFRFADGLRVSDAEIEPHEISAVGWDGKDGMDRALYLRGLVGCKRAHVRCLEEAMRNGTHALLLCEDDAAFRKNWRVHLELAVAQAPAGWLQIYLSGHPFEPTQRVTQNLQRANGLWLTTAVLYSKAGIREALASARNAQCEIDHWLGIDLHPRGASYLMDPTVAYQVSGYSDSRGTWREELG